MSSKATIGEILRNAREAKHISIAAAAMQTGLKSNYIQNLEKNQFVEMGAPVFARGYLINYSRFLGLDVAEMVEMFKNVCQGDTELHISNANIASQPRPYQKRRMRPIIIAVICVLVAIAIASQVIDSNSWLMRSVKSTFFAQNSAAAPATQTADETTDSTQNIVLQMPSDDTSETNATNDATTPSADSDAAPLSLESTSDLPASATAPAAPDDAAAASDAPSAAAPAAEPESTTATTPPPAASAAAATLAITDNNWVEVRDAARHVVVSKIFSRGEHITLTPDNAPYYVNVGRPSAITLQINGQQANLATYRQQGSTRKFLITLDK